jgi:hypothetical protein
MFAAPWAFATRSRPEYDGPNGRHERPVVDRLLRRVGPLTLACRAKHAPVPREPTHHSLAKRRRDSGRPMGLQVLARAQAGS